MSKLWTLAALSALLLVGMTAHAGVLMIDGHAMMPLRDLGSYFGASVSYDSQAGIGISLDYQKAVVRPGYRTVWFGDRKVLLDADVLVVDGITYVPVSFLRDVYGYDSRWDAAAQQVIIVHPRTHKRVVMVCDRHPRPTHIVHVVRPVQRPRVIVVREDSHHPQHHNTHGARHQQQHRGAGHGKARCK